MKNTSFLIILLVILFLALNATQASISITLSGAQSNRSFFSGEDVQLTLFMPGNLQNYSEVVLNWQTLVRPAVIEKGKEIIKLKSGQKNKLTINFKMPEVKQRTELVCKIKIIADKKEIINKEILYSVFPKDIPRNLKNILSVKRVGLLDKQGRLQDIFKYLDIQFVPLKSRLSLEAFEGDLIIIGPETISADYLHNILLTLEEKVNQGLGVLCFTYKDPPEFKMNLESVNPQPELLWASEITAPGHPVFQGIKEKDFLNWTIYPYALPQGNFRALLRTDTSEEDSPLIEFPHGRGKFIFCQMPVIERFDLDPAARIFLENLIRYACLEQIPLQPAIIYAGPESQTLEILDSIGVVGLRNPEELSKADYIIICADIELKLLNNKRFQQELNKIIRQGSTLIIFGFSLGNEDLFKRLIPGLEWAECVLAPVDIDKENPILWGITKNDIEQIFSMDLFFSFSNNKNMTMLVKPGLMAKIEQGQGRIIICPGELKEDNPKNIPFISQLLTNLGVKISGGDNE